MATITPVWTIAQSLFLNNSVAAGAQVSTTINANGLGFDIVDVGVKVGFFGSPDGPTQIQVFSSVDSGVTVSNLADVQFDITQVTCSNQIKTVKGLVGPHHTITATNSDSADGIHLTVAYAGRKWDST
jgi:hypothetical protein